jgi:hypothetical protein
VIGSRSASFDKPYVVYTAQDIIRACRQLLSRQRCTRAES